MITKSTAFNAIDFVFDALRKPDEALAREDMGVIHEAMAPHLRNWKEDCKGRVPVMVSAVGSINYDCVVESSDLDMKAVYLPSFEDLYFSRFPKYSFVTTEFDCELHPMHEFKKHMLKGNMNFFEVVYSCACKIYPDFSLPLDALQQMIEMNVKQTCLSTFFMASQMYAKSNAVDASKKSFLGKPASHALRLLLFAVNMIESGDFDIIVPEDFRVPIIGLKAGVVDSDEFLDLYDQLNQAVMNSMFKYYYSSSEFEFSDRVKELDGKNSDKWKELDAYTDNELMSIIKDAM